MDDIKIKHKRGRPFGYRLSEETKEKIRQKRLGTKHSIETRNKISKSLKAYFSKRNSLAKSIKDEYLYISDEALEWIDLKKDEIDSIKDVFSTKRLLNLRQLEVNFGFEIEDLFGHNMTPEFLILIKEFILDNKLGDLIDIDSII